MSEQDKRGGSPCNSCTLSFQLKKKQQKQIILEFSWKVTVLELQGLPPLLSLHLLDSGGWQVPLKATHNLLKNC